MRDDRNRDGRDHRRDGDSDRNLREQRASDVAWWREAMACALDPLYRIALLRRFSFLGLGLGTVGCTETLWLASAHGDPNPATAEERDGGDPTHDLLPPWYFAEAVGTDVRGSGHWLAMIPELESHLAPAQAALWPYYRPTLFQILAPGQDAELRAAITPIYTIDMCRAYARGQRLLSLLARKGPPPDTAVIVDAPGPEAVAAGAALAAEFDPVFMFDNWPHKRGVVPSHLTLAAALYFAPVLEDRKNARAAHRPPVFILDSNRLAPYSEAADDFDNRYLIELPEAQAFAQLGIKHLLYVSGRVQKTELDDLNDDFVALFSNGIDIKLLALDDFRRASGEQSCAAEDQDPYLFGGYEEADREFWQWYAPDADFQSGLVPVWLWSRNHYRPTKRPTFYGQPVAGHPDRPDDPDGGMHPSGLPPWPDRAIDPYFGGGGRSGSFGRWHASFTS